MNKIPSVLFAFFLLSVIPVSQAEIDFSGFGSFVVGISDNEDVIYNGYSTEDFTFDPDSLVGLQATSSLSDKASTTVQLVARAANEWDVEVDWAYLQYQVNDQLSWRIGRLRSPFYLYSEYITVNYAYPWISPPLEVYSISFSNINGADIIYQPTFGSVDALFQFYLGSERFMTDPGGTFNGAELETRNQFGFVAQFSWQSWETRFAYHGADVYGDLSNSSLAPLIDTLNGNGETETADTLNLEDDFFEFLAFALSYNNGTFLGVFETISLSANDEAPFPDQIAYFATAGFQFNTSQVHITWSIRDDDEPNLTSDLDSTSPFLSTVEGVQASLPNERENITLGYRWDFAPKTAFKVEVSSVDITDQDEDVLLLRTGVNLIF